MKINIIGDIAGRYDELLELLAKMPSADLVLSVGDIIDRGPKSREVVEWFMADSIGREVVFANHELICLEAHRNYDEPHYHPYWSYNGGTQTLWSYGFQVPHEHLRWMEKRPSWFRHDGLFVSHAPVRDVANLPPEYDDYDYQKWYGDESTWPWNRYLSAKPMPDHFMVYGHNSSYREHHYTNEDGTLLHYATCIDNSRHRELMGLHWPTREIFSVEYN